MGTQYYKDIQNAIDRYYEQHASGDIAIYGDTFVRRCISSIWGMAISPIRIEYTNDSVENLHETIKLLTGNDDLEIESSSSSQLALKLPNVIWYIGGSSTYGYRIHPFSNDFYKVSVLSLVAHDAAELMLAFDSFIPQILERAETVIMKKAEKEKICEILKVSAEGMINRLAAEGVIQIKDKAIVTCRQSNKIEVDIDSTRWIVSSIEEIEALLKKRYAKK